MLLFSSLKNTFIYTMSKGKCKPSQRHWKHTDFGVCVRHKQNLCTYVCVVTVTIKQLLCVVEVVTQCMLQKRFRMWENIISIFPHAKSFLRQHTLHDNINNIKKQNHCKRAHKYMGNVHIHPTQISVHFPTTQGKNSARNNVNIDGSRLKSSHWCAAARRGETLGKIACFPCNYSSFSRSLSCTYDTPLS